MIGTIAFTRDGVDRVATLDDDRSWSVEPPLDDAETIGILDLICSLYGGPSDGAFGPAQVSRAGQYLSGIGYEVTATGLAPRGPMPPGTIY